MSGWINYYKGQIINNLKIIKEINTKKQGRYFMFKCYCGNKFTALVTNVNRGKTKSCGCYRSKMCKARGHDKLTHGDSANGVTSYFYNTWAGMKARCYSKKATGYHNYGGRGITVYEPWIKDYTEFKSYILSVIGERPDGYTLDRINNDGNYEPNNMRWATGKEQLKNRREEFKSKRV